MQSGSARTPLNEPMQTGSEVTASEAIRILDSEVSRVADSDSKVADSARCISENVPLSQEVVNTDSSLLAHNASTNPILGTSNLTHNTSTNLTVAPNAPIDSARSYVLGSRPKKSPRQDDDDDIESENAIDNENDATVGNQSDVEKAGKSDDDDTMINKNVDENAIIDDDDITNVIENKNRDNSVNSGNSDNGVNVDYITTCDKIKVDGKTHCARSLDLLEQREQLQEILDTCLQHNDDDDDNNKPYRSDKSLGLLSTARVGQPGGKSDNVLLAQADPCLLYTSPSPRDS